MAAKRVLASGVFDILHPGHLHYLAEAKRHGDELVVVITSDGHAERTKRRPRHSQADRAKLVDALDVVDAVVIGEDPYDLETTTRAAAPDVIALGYDQDYDEAALAKELADLGITVEIVRIGRDGAGTSTSGLYGSSQ